MSIQNKFNGKELDNISGLNWYDFSARYYDDVLGRFTTPDPMAEMYYSISPYAAFGNSPLRFVDPTGMRALDTQYHDWLDNQNEGEGMAFGSPPETTGIPTTVDANGKVTLAQDNTYMPKEEINLPIKVQQSSLPPPSPTGEIRSTNVENAKQQFNEAMNDPVGVACLTDPTLKAVAAGGLVVTAAAVATTAASAVPEVVNTAAVKLNALVQATPAIVNNAVLTVEGNAAASAALGAVDGIVKTQMGMPPNLPYFINNPMYQTTSDIISNVWQLYQNNKEQER